MRRRHARREHGFTLIELSIVVAIVGVLAVIAVVAYRKYILHSKITEAEAVISAIRIAQEDYRAETGRYLNLGGTNFCPMSNATGGTSNVKWGWQPTCSGGAPAPPSGTAPTWAQLPVHVDGPVQFGYATRADAQGVAVDVATWAGWPAAPPRAWFVVHAKADLDGDTTNATELVGSSFENRILRLNEGQ